jgi:signal transduction histidine kinase
VGNLISNAVKFGDGKPVEISVSSDERNAHLTVTDHGAGISPENQARIFDKFERAVPDRHYGGFGLGLWIARQIVEAHGGTIRVVSESGRGSSFLVDLPLSDGGSRA